MELLDYILKFIIIFYLYSSFFIFIFSMWTKRDLDKKPLLKINFLNKYFFYIGFFFFLAYFFYGGFEKVLFFIPENFGYEGEDGWISYKFHFSASLAVLTALFLSIKIDKKL